MANGKRRITPICISKPGEFDAPKPFTSFEAVSTSFSQSRGFSSPGELTSRTATEKSTIIVEKRDERGAIIEVSPVKSIVYAKIDSNSNHSTTSRDKTLVEADTRDQSAMVQNAMDTDTEPPVVVAKKPDIVEPPKIDEPSKMAPKVNGPPTSKPQQPQQPQQQKVAQSKPATTKPINNNTNNEPSKAVVKTSKPPAVPTQAASSNKTTTKQPIEQAKRMEASSASPTKSSKTAETNVEVVAISSEPIRTSTVQEQIKSKTLQFACELLDPAELKTPNSSKIVITIQLLNFRK